MSLPTGTVTFMFTDIEGSTRLIAAVGDEAYRDLLDAERRLVMDAAVAEGGVPFGSEGDAHFVAFEAAPAGVRAAVRAQLALAAHPWPGAPVLVRIGLHSGDVRIAGDDYVGLEVHRAARIAAAAHGRQVLVSGATRSLAASATDGFGYRPLGDHPLKDFGAPEPLYQVEAPGLPGTFPPPRTLRTHPGNLPAQLSSFVGRHEVAAAGALLERSRLLTLTGPGGTGKTRLSLAIAADVADRFPAGTWFVPLASVNDPGLVISSIATTVGLVGSARSPQDRLVEHFGDRPALLVLDNFEQVLDGGPEIGALLEAIPQLRVLASSRAPMRIRGEQEFPVPPLGVPPAGAVDIDAIARSDAVRLFVERSSAVRPGFVLGPDNAADVAEIVRRLDGLPLAIELAAARSRMYSPAAMVRRLGDLLGLLESGARDVPERQRTFRGAVEWSVRLLDPADRILFARLGVFVSGAPMDIAAEVCRLDVDAPPQDVPSAVERLAEQSLVRIGEGRGGDIRATMLETIREVALGRLVASGEIDAIRERHARAYLAFATTLPAAGEPQATRVDRLAEEHDNLRAALDWFVGTGDGANGAALVAALWRFWQMRGFVDEGRRRADSVLALGCDDPQMRLRLLEAAGGLAYWGADPVAASRHYAEAEAIARSLGDDREIAEALYNRFFAGDTARAVETWSETYATEGKPHLEEAIAIWSRLGDGHGRARGLWALAEHHASRKEWATAIAVLTEALATFEHERDEFWISWTRFTRAFNRFGAGDVAGAADDLLAAMSTFVASRDASGHALVLAAAGSLLLVAGRTVEAHRIAGAARRASADTGVRLPDAFPLAADLQVPTDPDDPELAEAQREGARLESDEALELVRRLVADVARSAAGGGGGAADGVP